MSNSPEKFTLRVVGVSFLDRQHILNMYKNYLDAGVDKDKMKVTLKREMHNEKDPFAIAVYIDHYKIGYIAKDVAQYAAPELDNGTLKLDCELESISRASEDSNYGCLINVWGHE